MRPNIAAWRGTGNSTATVRSRPDLRLAVPSWGDRLAPERLLLVDVADRFGFCRLPSSFSPPACAALEFVLSLDECWWVQGV
jgi:hypothetical protein